MIPQGEEAWVMAIEDHEVIEVKGEGLDLQEEMELQGT